MSTTTATASYRKTKQGEWVAYGPAATMRIGSVHVAKRDGTVKAETVTRLGKPFAADGVEMVYGYLSTVAANARPTQPRSIALKPRRTSRRQCVTGGNCSSFGTGNSCGANDCDGF